MTAIHPTPQASPEQRGFTLLELSIVIGIIGMVAAGILTGQSLDKAAKINQAVAMHAQFASAWNAFKATYNALPGDMPDATEVWNTNSTLCPLLPGTLSADGTCNGTGNGKVSWFSYAQGGASPSLQNSIAEANLVFQHLQLSGLLKLANTGAATNASVTTPAYVNPNLRVQYRAAWFMGSTDPAYADLYSVVEVGGAYQGTSVLGNALQTATVLVNGGQPLAAVATPEMVMAIDKKMDDGLPRKGKFQASKAVPFSMTDAFNAANLLDCIVDDGAGGYKYNLRLTTDACRFLMQMD